MNLNEIKIYIYRCSTIYFNFSFGLLQLCFTFLPTHVFFFKGTQNMPMCLLECRPTQTKWIIAYFTV